MATRGLESLPSSVRLTPDHLPRLTAACHDSDVANASLAGIAAQMPQASLHTSSSMA